MHYFIITILFLFVLPFQLFPVEDGLLEDLFCKGIHADLREPTYSDGVLNTTKGGVISGPDLRIQALKMTYTRLMKDGKPCYTIEAEGDLLLEFNDYIFVGERLEYDFQTKTGIIYQGRSSAEPWFFGGDRIFLRDDGSYLVENGYLTTSESACVQWKISSQQAILYPNKDFKASKVKFQFFNRSLFWLPELKVNLDYIFDSPIRYSARWGGRQGPRTEFIYEIFSWNRLKTFLRFDYRLTRGPGLGFETYYRSEDHLESFEAINYIARDSSIEDPNENMRFRFQGAYSNVLMDKKLSINFVYDKLSDKYMASDYSDSGLDLEYTGMTRLRVRRQERNMINNFTTTVRLNYFQSVVQELPSLKTSYRPFEVKNLGVISDTNWQVAYLDYKYANNITNEHNFRSTRIQFLQKYYRPIHFGALNITPEAGGVAIYYSDVPEKNQRMLLTGIFSMKSSLPFFRTYGNYKHVVTPYVNYNYYTYPTSPPSSHYIFDVNDGWYRLNMMTFGIQQSLYFKAANGLVGRTVKLDLYANAFFNTKTLPQTLQKIYADLSFYTSPCLKHSLNTAWDVAHHSLGHFNLRTEWTASENFAVASEYRYRNKYDWRKADHTNFVMESYSSERELLRSTISDKRQTILLHLFYRFHPNWALQLHSRNGWNRRKCQPPYNEFEIDLLGTMQSAWQVKISYQHRENDHHRFSIGFDMGLQRPDRWKCEHHVPMLNL